MRGVGSDEGFSRYVSDTGHVEGEPVRVKGGSVESKQRLWSDFDNATLNIFDYIPVPFDTSLALASIQSKVVESTTGTPGVGPDG
jgi:hypothetical protein